MSYDGGLGYNWLCLMSIVTCENCKKKFFIIRNIIELHYSKIIFNIIILLFDKKYFSV